MLGGSTAVQSKLSLTFPTPPCLQFAYLKRLLLVHGHWCYLRNSNMCVGLARALCADGG